MINICCVQWGNKYTDDYVEKLYNSIKRNTSIKFNFFVFSDHIRGEWFAKPMHQYLLLEGTKGWYNKLQLFILDNVMPNDQTFFFDLDTVIVGNLDSILSYKGSFIILRDFYRKDGLGSGLMSWHTGKHKHIWDSYKGGNTRQGDQGHIEIATNKKVDLWQESYPEEVVSYKVHCLKGVPTEARVICFHGKPAVHEVKENWVRNNWI